MNSESGQRLSVEELKRLNLPPQSAPMFPAHPPQQEWSEQLARLERLEASAERTGGHASGIEPTGGAAAHSGAVGGPVAGGGASCGRQCDRLGRRKELSISPPGLIRRCLYWPG